MKFNPRQHGLSLIEQTLVVGIVGALVYFGLPAARQLFDTMETPAGTKALISSALASARAIAAREQKCVGIRFQHACYINPQGNAEPLESPYKMPQYMIFIMYDNEATNLINGFKAIEGINPIKLPDSIGVMDLTLNPEPDRTEIINNNGLIDDDLELADTTAFSIVFMPSGKLIMRKVQTRNRDAGYYDSTESEDDIFNTITQVEQGVARFLQDENLYKTLYGLDEEPSRRSFIIYDRSIFEEVDPLRRWEDYLEDLDVIYINPYTGTFINR
jgi:hypothetical protein